jgi:hypothetical protein
MTLPMTQGTMPTSNRLRILFLVSAHNSLSQRIFIALTEQGHDVISPS